ncbi:MAG: TetR family transcriptional regulator [Propionibacteriales bacterium]|nr:TetR family transcriptional regulator [Propionibacteriales bacterium]
MASSPRKVEIMTAARNLLAVHGFAGTTMAAIAAEVSVVESALYRHFTSKNHLFRETVSHFYEPVLKDIENAAENIGDPVAIVRYVIRRHVRSYIEIPELNRLVVVQARQSSAEEEMGVADLNRRYTSVLTRTVAAGVADGSLRSDLDPRLVRDMIFGAIEHVWLRHEAHGEQMDVEAVSDDIYALLEPALLPPSDLVEELRVEVDRLGRLLEALERRGRSASKAKKAAHPSRGAQADGRRQ